MKTKKFLKKLDLNKKTIADLDSKAIGKIYGGKHLSHTTACVEACVTCLPTCDLCTATCRLSVCAC
jgi:hypothetical protein